MGKLKEGNELSWMKDELREGGGVTKHTYQYRASITSDSLALIERKIKVLSLTSLVLNDL